MAVTTLRDENDDASVASVTLHPHHVAKLDRFVAQARRHATRSGAQFAGVVVEIDASGALTAHAAGLEPLML